MSLFLIKQLVFPCIEPVKAKRPSPEDLNGQPEMPRTQNLTLSLVLAFGLSKNTRFYREWTTK